MVTICSRPGDASPKIPFPSLFVALRCVPFIRWEKKLCNTAGEFSCRFSFAIIGVEASPHLQSTLHGGRESQLDKDQKS